MKIIVSLCLILACLIGNSSAYTTDHLAREISAFFPKASGQVLSSLGSTATVRIVEGEVKAAQYLRVYAIGETIRHPLTDEYLGQREYLVGLIRLERASIGADWLARRVAAKQELNSGMRIRSGERKLRMLYLGDAGEIFNQEMELSLAKTGAFEIVNMLNVERAKSELQIAELTQQSLPKLANHLNIDIILDLTTTQKGGEQNLNYKIIDTMSFQTLVDGEFALREFYTEQITSADSAEAAIVGAWQTKRVDTNYRLFDPVDVNNDGTPEMVMLAEGSVALASISQGEIKVLAEERSLKGSPLSVVAADMDNNGRPELYVSLIDNKRVYTLVFDLMLDSIKRRATIYDAIVYRSYTENSSDVLMQKVPPGEFFGGSIHHFILQNNSLETVSEVSKRGVELVGAANIDEQWVNYTADGKIAVFDNNYRRLGATSNDFGGFIIPISFSDDKRIYAKKRVLPIKTRSGNYLVAMHNEPFLGFLSIATSFKGSDLRLLRKNGTNFNEVYRSVYISRAVMSDAAFTDVNNDGRNEIVVLMNYRNATGSATGGSAFLFFQIDAMIDATP